MQPFIWMFKVKEFKKHFLCLACFSIALFTLFLETKWIGYLCSIVSGLYLTGYFWNLTEQIIHRDRSIEASNIYDGKIKETYTITLPKLDLIDNICRCITNNTFPRNNVYRLSTRNLSRLTSGIGGFYSCIFKFIFPGIIVELCI